MTKLYENIKRRRKMLGMTQTDLALKVGYSDKSMIAKIEAGKVDLTQSKIVVFADALCTTAYDLMGFDSENDNLVSNNEYDLIRKYRELGSESRDYISMVIDREYDRK